MRLSHYAVGQDNNFTLLRLSPRRYVLFTHSVARSRAAAGYGAVSSSRFGRTIGEMGLDMLFVTSGFLGDGSLLNRAEPHQILLGARVARLSGALGHASADGFLFGAGVTTLTPREFFSAPQTWEYLREMRDRRLRHSLHASRRFSVAALKGEFNGSLWTLPVEMRMYLYLAATWLAFAFTPNLRLRGVTYLAPVVAVAYGFMVARIRLTGGTFTGPEIAVFMWLYGSALWYWRHRAPMSWGVFAALVGVLVLASFNKQAAFIAYLVCMAPLVLHLAYLPADSFGATARPATTRMASTSMRSLRSSHWRSGSPVSRSSNSSCRQG